VTGAALAGCGDGEGPVEATTVNLGDAWDAQFLLDVHDPADPVACDRAGAGSGSTLPRSAERRTTVLTG